MASIQLHKTPTGPGLLPLPKSQHQVLALTLATQPPIIRGPFARQVLEASVSKGCNARV